jgi:hypothetical protein
MTKDAQFSQVDVAVTAEIAGSAESGIRGCATASRSDQSGGCRRTGFVDRNQRQRSVASITLSGEPDWPARWTN